LTHPIRNLPQDRLFHPDPAQRRVARELYEAVAKLPLVCPHGHVDPRLLADPNASFGTPAELLIIPDHYVFRMLYSQGIPLEALGIPRRDGGPVERDHRKIWQTFADNFFLFRGTPTGIWLAQELEEVFGVHEKLTSETAESIYDQIEARLATPEFRPRALFEHFNIEVLCTTDAASDSLQHHQAIRTSGWKGKVLPTFRPDAVVNLRTPDWHYQIDALSQSSGVHIHSFSTFVQAVEERRGFFQRMGATATDLSAESAYTVELSQREADAIFQRALHGEATPEDARRFAGQMIVESARMSIDDGLVMQLHVGSVRKGKRHPQACGIHPESPPPPEPTWERQAPDAHPLQSGRNNLRPRSGPPGGTLSGCADRTSLVVSR
jgi:glucuronate isomerase